MYGVAEFCRGKILCYNIKVTKLKIIMIKVKKLYIATLVLLVLTTLCVILFTDQSASDGGDTADGTGSAQNENAAVGK